jgi:hypothetical protein
VRIERRQGVNIRQRGANCLEGNLQQRLAHAVQSVPALLLIAVVRLYQYSLSPWMHVLGVCCRFEPTCSHYFIGAVRNLAIVPR